MKEALARLSAIWKGLPQSTKLLLAGLLLVGAVTLWYVGFYLPAQAPLEAQAPTPRALEAPSIPPLAEPAQTEAPKEPEKPTEKTEAAPTPTPPQPANLPVPRAERQAPPPNPFVPLLVETPPAPSPAAPTPRPSPVPTGAPVRVSGGTPLPAPTLPSAPKPLPGTAGALPAPQVLKPTLRAEVPQTRVEPPVEVAAPEGLVEAALPEVLEASPPRPEEAPSPLPKSPLATLVEEKGLRLSGTLLGPLSVAILESKEGYLVLPAGSPLPGSEAVIRRIESDRVILALKDETLEIPLAGGER